MVVLDGQDVVAPPLEDRPGEIGMGEHRVGGDDGALQGEDLEQLQGRLVLVGLAIHPELGQHDVEVGSIGGQEVDAGDLAVDRPAQGFAVDGDLAGARSPRCAAIQAETAASNRSMSRRRKRLEMEALHGVSGRVKPSKAPKPRPRSRGNWAMASSDRAPQRTATVIRLRMAGSGWRRPKGDLGSGREAKQSQRKVGSLMMKPSVVDQTEESFIRNGRTGEEN